MQGTVVGVLRGGPGHEHEVSLASGHSVISNLPPERFSVRDIYIDKEGNWNERGRRADPARVLAGIDAAFVTLHGEYGENGELQRMLERFGVAYTGADPLGSFLSMHKALSKQRARELGIKVARDILVEQAEDAERAAHEAIRKFPQPVVVKPVRWGSSAGVSVVGGFLPVYEAIASLFERGCGTVLVEELIRGTEATAGVVDGLRNERLYALPPVEILPPEQAGFFSYEAKYSGESKEIVPGRFPRKVAEELQDAARAMHDALGLRHYSRSDFIVAPSGVYYLETNGAVGVGLTGESLLPKSLAAVGISLGHFFEHVLGLAMKGK
jgi:D-alanine-D-alanine ligase